MLVYAIVFITLALILYSIGVWSEKIQNRLKVWHVIVFWCGFACDTAGTALMGMITDGGFILNFHAITGVIAILLMLFHAIWATIVLYRKNERLITQFHKFSIVVWLIWLIPFISGMVIGMGG